MSVRKIKPKNCNDSLLFAYVSAIVMPLLATGQNRQNFGGEMREQIDNQKLIMW